MNKMKVLCIDDNEKHLKIITDIVEEEEHQSYSANSVQEAFHILNTEDIDCIIADFTLTGDELNGVELYLKAKEEGYSNYVIFITSSVDILNSTCELDSNVNILMKKSHTYREELEANIQNCFALRVREVSGSYAL